MSKAGHVVVIGAGVAGLAAAYRLQDAGLRVTVLERDPVVGGRTRSAMVEGCRIELGAEFIASFYRRTLALIAELGLSRDLQRIPRSAAVLRGTRLYSLWPNARVAFTPLIGSRHKLALSYLLGALVRYAPLLDLHAFERAASIDDQSVSTYACTHLSEELLEYVLQPALSGIFYWTPERTSRALLMLVLRAGLSTPTGLQLFTLRDGLGQLAQRLADELDVRTSIEALHVQPCAEGGYMVAARSPESMLRLPADAVLLATTASSVPRLLPWLEPQRRAFFSAVSYTAMVNLAVGTNRRLPRSLYGLLFPRRETPFLASVTVQSVKHPGAVPRGRDVIALHLSGPATAALHQYDDATLARLMLADLRRLAPVYDPAPQLLFQHLHRWPEALPEFAVGHFKHLQHFASGAVEPPGLAFAGDYLGGPFIEGAIVSGEAAALRLIRQLQS